MKRLIPLSLTTLLILTQVGCSPTGSDSVIVPGVNNTQSQVSPEELNDKIESFDLMLLHTNQDKAVNPITPERIQSLKLDGKSIDLNSILLPGSEENKALANSDQDRFNTAQKVAEGGNLVVFGGKGIFSFLTPQSDQNTLIEIKLKDDAQTYQIVRLENLSRGTMVLENGKVRGAFDTLGGFAVKGTGEDALALIQKMLSNPDLYYALSNFDFKAFVNTYFSEGVDVKVFTEDKQLIKVSALSPQETSSEADESSEAAEIKAAIEEQVANGTRPLTRYIGTWTPESDFILNLVPGGKLDLGFAAVSDLRYRASATLDSDSFAGEGQVDTLDFKDKELSIQVTSGGNSLDLKLKYINNNRVSVSLEGISGISDLQPMIGTEVFLKRLK